jgi:thioredoxin-related protein
MIIIKLGTNKMKLQKIQRDYLKKTILSVVLLMLFAGGCGESKTSAAAKNAENLTWLSFNDGYALAIKEKKHLLVDFYADWCSWCKVMETETFTKPNIVNKLNANYVIARVYTDKNSEKIQFKDMQLSPQEFAAGMGINGLPTLLFFDIKGEPVTKIPGFMDEKALLPVLEYISDGCYNTQVSFDDYLKDKTRCSGKKL